MAHVSSGALCALFMAFAPLAHAISYDDDAQPILGAKCIGCHTVGSSGGHNIGQTYEDALGDSSVCDGKSVAACSIDRIKDGSMPLGANCGGVVADDAPNASQCVTVSELAVLEAWLAAGLPEETCVPVSCADSGVSCGELADGCGGLLACGVCAEGSSCTEGACVEDCVPSSDCGGAMCGAVDDGCGGSISCGTCPEGQGCDAGTCVDGCVPASCAEGACGAFEDGCGAMLDCGACAEGSTCTDGLCVVDCLPTECAEGACGEVDDGCGATLDCGACAEGSTCTEGLCVADCLPAECAEGACGEVEDGCGGVLSCGACAEGSTCTEGLCVAESGGDAEGEPAPAGPDYVHDVQPILGAKCAPCHTTGGSGGHSVGVNYLDSQDDAYYCSDLVVGACSITRIKDGSMPPGGACGGPVADDAENAATCITESEMAVLEAWVNAGMPEGVDGDAGAVTTNGETGDQGPSAEGGEEVAGSGSEADEGGCRSSQGSLGWLMVLIATLSLVAQRRRTLTPEKELYMRVAK